MPLSHMNEKYIREKFKQIKSYHSLNRFNVKEIHRDIIFNRQNIFHLS